MVGILLVGALGVAGCGGGSATTGVFIGGPPISSERSGLERTVDKKLAKLDAPAKEIRCVNENIASMTAAEMAERLVESAPAGKETVVNYLGPLGKGCP